MTLSILLDHKFTDVCGAVVEFIKRSLDIWNILLSVVNVNYFLRVQGHEKECHLCSCED